MTRVAIILATLAIASAGCSTESPTTEPTVTPTGPITGYAAPSERPPSEVPTSVEPTERPAAAALPAELIGTWGSAGGEAEIIYRFARDGVYEYAGVLTQQRPSGVFSLTISAVGTVSVDGPVLVVQPTRGTREITDSDSPSSDRTTPVDTTAQRYRWAVRGSQLVLTDGKGTTITYDRQ
jgi:hypothetical protein